MAELAEVWKSARVLELGPGTGALTSAIVDTMPHEAEYLGLELNAPFVGSLRRRFPRHRFEVGDASAFDLSGVWPEAGSVDVVISGLPWAAFPTGLQQAILDNVLPHLKPGGRFATFAYYGFHQLPAGRRFRRLLHDRLPGVESSRVLWANLPPAFVYVGRKASAG
jgi:phosphatidylethanolamine/phosphatidyl-N-methylethanolamine N-methyltransferase